MIHLTLTVGESFKIGDDVTVTVIKSVYGRVHLDMDAPDHIPVHREAIANRIQRNRDRELVRKGIHAPRSVFLKKQAD